jgi:hypothetical protein
MARTTFFNVPSTVYKYRPGVGAGTLGTEHLQLKVEPLSGTTGRVTLTLEALSPGLPLGGGTASLTDFVIQLDVRGCQVSNHVTSAGNATTWIRPGRVGWYRPSVPAGETSTYSVDFSGWGASTRQRYQVLLRAHEFHGLYQTVTAREALPPV